MQLALPSMVRIMRWPITGEAAPVESQLSIDSATGEVTLSGELDPATQSEYSFTVTATDTAGNSSDLDVVVDAEQPMVDAAMVVVVDGDTAVSAHLSGERQY